MFDFIRLARLARSLSAAMKAGDVAAVVANLRELATHFGQAVAGEIVGRLIEAVASGNWWLIADVVGDALKFVAGFGPHSPPLMFAAAEPCEAFAATCEIEADESRPFVAGVSEPVGISPALIIGLVQIGIQVARWLRERRQAA